MLFAAIVDDRIIGPYMLPTNVDGETMLMFFRQYLGEFREKIPQEFRDDVWIMFDGAPIHTYCRFREYVARKFHGRVIMKYCRIPWPPRSPDLNILDFFFWGVLKTFIYEKYPNPPQSVEECCERIREAVGNISKGMIRRAQQNILKRVHCCLRHNGDIFEHHLKLL